MRDDRGHSRPVGPLHEGRPTGHPLETIEWRLERANEHLAALDHARDAFVSKENRRVVGEFERETSEYVFRFEGELPDPRIGLIVSEFSHHLRAALDNLLWQLVLTRGGSPTHQTQFPIHERRKGYRERTARALRGVSADDRAAIEAIQPFQNGERASQSYLAILAWLNNVDKHRFVHVGCAFPRRTPIVVSYGAEGEFAGHFPWNPRFVKDVAKILDVRYVPTFASDDRTELARVRIEPSGPDPQMEMDADAPIEIAMSDREHALIISDLRRIHDSVTAIIEGFKPRFRLDGRST